MNSEKINEIKNGNGIVIEHHDNGDLKFKGEYLNGEKNGKGKEYYKGGEIKYEGEYLKGKRWTGKLHYYCHEWGHLHLHYELKNGNGKNITVNNYEDDYLNGKNGKGINYYDEDYDKKEYEGEFLNGLKNGIGKEYFYHSFFSI